MAQFEPSIIDLTVPSAEIKRALKLSELAYQSDKEGFGKGLQTLGIPYDPSTLLYINKGAIGALLTDTQLFVFVSRELQSCFVVFRGSKGWKDFLADADFHYFEICGKGSGVKVHSGFHDQFKAVRYDLYDHLAAHKESYRSVVFCGHSLGAGLATLALPMFNHYEEKNLWEKKELFLYTFGSPRVGNQKFSSYFNGCVPPDNHWRVFNNHDIVSKLLPRTSILDEPYQHIDGNSIRLFSNADLSGEFNYRLEKFDMESISFEDGGAYHHCEHYIKCLDECFPSNV